MSWLFPCGFSQNRGTSVRVPRMRTRVYWDPLILGNYRVGFYDCIYTRGSIIAYQATRRPEQDVEAMSLE